MIAFGSDFQTNGLGFALCVWMKQLIACWRSTTERKTACFSGLRVSLVMKGVVRVVGWIPSPSAEALRC